ncbi:MAG: GNAT family N-acetyltransferase [Hyphomicrobiaceae bacterium]|nr:GNAT family N-acetyltransferase [Hyphomicrobiaceae bacterium]
MIIETERLVLRPFTLDDLNEFAAINADPDVMRFFPSTLTRAQSMEAIERYLGKLAADGYSFLAAELETTGELAGVIGISRIDETLRDVIAGRPEVEVGWRLRKDLWGQGLATEGAAACIDYGFEALGLSEIVALTTTGNLPSRRVMQKLGMVHVPGASFLHPKVPAESGLQEHVLYRIGNPQLAADA